MRLGDHLEQYLHQLSEGMKQRVNLARALLTEPKLLLLDEPFSALDIETRRLLQNDLLALWHERNMTILMVSHALEEVVYMADRVGVCSAKPTQLTTMVPISLSRPRSGCAKARLEMLEQVEALEILLRTQRT